jgi:hypothetical protein
MVAIRLFAFSTLFVVAAYVGWSALAPSGQADRLHIVRDGSQDQVELRIGSVRLRVSPHFLRKREDIVGGQTSELQLALDARTFGPPPRLAPLAPDEPEAMADAIYVTITPPDPAVEPADRMARLYGRFLESDVGASLAGLERRSFEPGSPYEGEDLYFTPPEGRLFAARCLRKKDGQPPGQCIADMRISGLDVRLRFARRHLEHWDRLTTGVVERVGGMAR